MIAIERNYRMSPGVPTERNNRICFFYQPNLPMEGISMLQTYFIGTFGW
jgi:hypothetical protein